MHSNAAVNIYSEEYSNIIHGKSNFSLLPAENLIRIFMINKLKDKITSTSFALDFGCGEGRNTSFLADVGYQVVATDVSDEAIAATQKRMNNVNNIEFVKIDKPQNFYDISNSFSIAVAWEVLHWIGEEELWINYLKSIVSKLASGGSLICTMPTEDHYLISLSEQYKESHFESNADSRKACKFFAPSLDQLKSYFKEFGAKDIQTFRYEHGREGYDMNLDNRFSMYAFYVHF